jgi:hypothetical protein
MTKSPPEPDLTPAPHRRRAKYTALAAAGVLLLSPAAAVAGYHVVAAAKSPTTNAISAVLGSGVMTKFPNGFRANDPATRGTVALALQRSIPRLAVQDSLGSLASSTPATEIGSVRLKVDGATGHRQGVLLSVQMQLDHDNALTTSCSASFQFKHDLSPGIVGTWSQELYQTGAGDPGQEDNIAFSVYTTQPTGKSFNYHLLAANSCTQTLFTDEDIMTAQSFPLGGNGKAVPPPAKVSTKVPQHDR